MDRNMTKKPGAGKRHQEVQRAYMALWKRFTEAAETQQLVTKAANETYGAQLRSGATTTAEALFVLPSWPYKARSDKRVDIVVQVVESMDAQINVVTKCTTQIGYFERKGEERWPLLELHYDFEMPVSEAHPIFHAQVGKTKWPLDELGKLGLVVKRRPDDDSEGAYGKARIPTAFVGFPQILAVLAADHLQHKAYRQVMAEVRATHATIPRVHCGHFGREVIAGIFPVAHHWYEHRYEASVTQAAPKGPWKAAIDLLGVEESRPSKADAENALIKTVGVSRDEILFVACKS